MLTEVKKKGETKRKKEDENKKGILEKARPGKNFFEKILWIEKLSLCLQCLNKWRLSSEKSWEPQKKRGYS